MIDSISSSSIINNTSPVSRQTSAEEKTDSIALNSEKITINSLKEEEYQRYIPEHVREYLVKVNDDPNVSQKEKSMLFFDVVLRPQVEARLGNPDADSIIKNGDSASWDKYLSNLSYLAIQDSKNPQNRADASKFENLSKHFSDLIKNFR